jgi:eukaryotic-like serine/threonine-protein kinase
MAIFTTVSGYRFGSFALDVRTGELTRNGGRIPLQEKPCSLLLALLEHPGELVTRDELRQRLWPDDTFVGFEDGLNTAASKLREALNDNRQSPQYIETVRGRGYRFIGEVESVAPRIHLAGLAAPAAAIEGEGPVPAARQPWLRAYARPVFWSALAACLVLVMAFGVWQWFVHGHAVLSSTDSNPVMIAEFDNQAGEPRFNAALRTALSVGLEQSADVTVYSRAQTQDALRLMEQPPDTRITPAVAREICRRQDIHALIAPGVRRKGAAFTVTAQLIDPQTGVVVRSYAAESNSQNHLIEALDQIAVKIRRDLGESRLSIRQSHLPLPQVTTASLAALEDYSDGSDLFDRGQANGAVTLYKAALAADPGFAMAHAALGYVYFSFYIHAPAAGEAEFRKALDLSSRTTEREHAWIELRYAESQGRVEDALGLYQQYVDRYPSDWAARAGYARLMRMHGHARESLALYEQLDKQDPSDPGLSIEEAAAYSQLDLWPQAIAAFEKAFSLDAHILTTGDVAREYGFSLVANQEEGKAEQMFTTLLKDPDSYADAERSLAFLDLYHGRYASARQRLELALAKSRDPFSMARIRYMLAVVAEGEGDKPEQMAQLDRITAKLDTIGPKVLYGALVGQAYARAGELARARKMLNTISPLVNERVGDQVVYAEILKAEVAAAAADYPTALSFLKPPEPDDSNASAVLLRESLGYIYQKMGNLDEAMAWMQKFINGRSSHATSWEPQQRLFGAYVSLAADYEQKGEFDDARTTLNAMLAEWDHADPNLPLLKRAQHLREAINAHR